MREMGKLVSRRQALAQHCAEMCADWLQELNLENDRIVSSSTNSSPSLYSLFCPGPGKPQDLSSNAINAASSRNPIKDCTNFANTLVACHHEAGALDLLWRKQPGRLCCRLFSIYMIETRLSSLLKRLELLPACKMLSILQEYRQP